jgi:hypothetical protein
MAAWRRVGCQGSAKVRAAECDAPLVMATIIRATRKSGKH